MKELRLAEISSVESGNDFLPGFVKRFNERLAVVPAKPEDLHSNLSVRGSRLKDILCQREQRHVSEQLALSCDRKQIILDRSFVSEKLAASMSNSTTNRTGRSRLRWKGVSLPYRVFERIGG